MHRWPQLRRRNRRRLNSILILNPLIRGRGFRCGQRRHHRCLWFNRGRGKLCWHQHCWWYCRASGTLRIVGIRIRRCVCCRISISSSLDNNGSIVVTVVIIIQKNSMRCCWCYQVTTSRTVLLLLLLFKKFQSIVVDVIKLQQVVQYYASHTVLCTMYVCDGGEDANVKQWQWQ